MKIILLKNIPGLGSLGEIKDVNDGYARNFLLPRKFAEVANEKSIKRVEKEKSEKDKAEKEDRERLKKIADEINGKSFVIKTKSKNEKLFGSIGKKEIAEVIGNNVTEEMIELKDNIKTTSESGININLGHNIKARVIIKIIGE